MALSLAVPSGLRGLRWNSEFVILAATVKRLVRV